MSILIQNVLVPTDDAYQTVDVEIADDRISAIRSSTDGSADVVNLETIDGRDKLLLPGFVNAHTHSSQIWQRGTIPQLPLEMWLTCVFDSVPPDLEQFYLGALTTAVHTLLSGGTCVMDHAYLVANQELETVAALVRGYKEAGIRAFIAPLIQDLPFAAGLPGGKLAQSSALPTAKILATMAAIVQEFHEPEAGISIAVGPTGFHRCSDDLFVGCAELSDRHNLCRHTHLLETRAQKMLAQERYGISSVAHLQQLGFLNDRTSLAHSVWLNDADIEILAQTGATVAYNPVSNLRLGSGIAPILNYLRAGVNVSFGCDGAASNDGQDLLEAIKLGTMLQTVTEPDYQTWLTPRQALAMAAMGGAKGVHLADQTGSLTAGKKADLVLYDLTHLSMLPCTDPLQLLLLGRPTDVVDRVWINGKSIVADGKLLTVDLDRLKQELRDRSRVMPKPQFQTIHQFEAHYRKVMEL